MSTGGVFMIITNDGRQDKILLATELLQKRIERIRSDKINAAAMAGQDTSKVDTTPTLMEIEQTHVLFVNAHFKPFAAIGFEYTVVKPTGNVNYGNDVQFSLPQFGEFLSDAMIRVVTDKATAVPSAASQASGANAPALRWCDYPGERFLQQAKIDINGNPLDQYNWETYVFTRQYELLPNKRAGWARCMGQQVADDAVLDEESSASTPGYEFHVSVTQGPQTWKEMRQDGLELMIPLMFWFNKDPRVALPSVAIPFGQRYITVTVAQAEQLMFIKDRGTGVTNASAEFNNGASTFNKPTINSMELYINNLFVLPEIHDVYIKRVGFSLIRVYRRQITNLTKSSDEIRLNAMKWPIEYMYIGASPSDNSAHFSHWHKFSVPTKKTYDLPNVLGAGTTYRAGSTGHYVVDSVESVTASGYTYESVFDTFRIRLQGVNIYSDYSSKFYNSYLPLAYGGINVNTPEDAGLLFVPFCIYPRIYQPSGYINVSRAREFDAIYSSQWIGSTNGSKTNTANMLVQGSAINFLIIAQSNASLRYST